MEIKYSEEELKLLNERGIEPYKEVTFTEEDYDRMFDWEDED